MTIAIVMFDRHRAYNAYSLANMNYVPDGPQFAASLYYWPNAHFRQAKALCATAQRLLGADYALFDLGNRRPSSSARVADSGLNFDPAEGPVSFPLYVPEGAEGLAQHYGWESALALPNTPRAPAPPWLYTIPAPPPPPVPIELEDTACLPSAPLPPSIRFEVRSGVNGTDRDTWGSVADFTSGRDAAAYVTRHKASAVAAGKSLVIVKVELEAVAVDWRERERTRLTDGTYTPLPASWGESIAVSYPDHFAHVAQSDKRKVAFTESAGSGERDKQKVLSASAYIERFFAPTWPGSMRSDFVADMLGSSIKPLFAPLGDVDALVKVYRDTAGGRAAACMSHPLDNYSSEIHPVSVYAIGGEITMALLRGYVANSCPEGEETDALNPDAAWDSEGPIVARCLVWERDGEPRGFGRVYPDGDNASRMLRTALETLGYKRDNCQGARIAKVPHRDRDDLFVMPYLDIGDQKVTDCGEYFTAGGDISSVNTNGLMELQETVTCDSCDDEYSERSMSTVLVGEDDEQQHCDSCRSGETFYCAQLDTYVSNEYRANYLPSGSRHSQSVAEWLFTNGTLSGIEYNGTYYEEGFVCADCEEGQSPDELMVWGDRETGDSSHSEGAELCSSCHAARETLVDDVEAVAKAEAEAELEEQAEADAPADEDSATIALVA